MLEKDTLHFCYQVVKEFYWGPLYLLIMYKVGRLGGECFQSSCPILPSGKAHTQERKEKSKARRMKREHVITVLPANSDKPSAAALKKHSCTSSRRVASLKSEDKNTNTHLCPPAVYCPHQAPFPHDAVMLAVKAVCPVTPLTCVQLNCE